MQAGDCETVGKRGAVQGIAVAEGFVPDAGHPLGDADAAQSPAAGKGTGADAGQAVREPEILQRRAVEEGLAVDVGHALGNGDTPEIPLAFKGAAADALHALRDDYGFLAAQISDEDAVDDGEGRHVQHPRRTVEGVFADMDEASWQFDAFEGAAAAEGALADMGHALGDDDACQILAKTEEVVGDPGHRLLADYGRDSELPVIAEVLVDADGAVLQRAPAPFGPEKFRHEGIVKHLRLSALAVCGLLWRSAVRFL